MDDIEQLQSLCSDLGITIDVVDDVSVLQQEVQAGNLVIPNALTIHPMEGADGDTEGNPGPLTFRRYKRFAAGGAGLIWAEAITVASEGRANPRQLWLHEEMAYIFNLLF